MTYCYYQHYFVFCCYLPKVIYVNFRNTNFSTTFCNDIFQTRLQCSARPTPTAKILKSATALNVIDTHFAKKSTITSSLLFSTFSKKSLSSCTLKDPFLGTVVPSVLKLLLKATAATCFSLLFLITESMLSVGLH